MSLFGGFIGFCYDFHICFFLVFVWSLQGLVVLFCFPKGNIFG